MAHHAASTRSASSLLDLQRTYIHLQGDGVAIPVPLDADFWSDLMSGARHYDRLLGLVQVAAHSTMWEMRPMGKSCCTWCPAKLMSYSNILARRESSSWARGRLVSCPRVYGTGKSCTARASYSS